MEEVMTNFDEKTDDLMGSSLTFMIGEKYYGIQLSYVNEIINMQKITRVPGLPSHISGIINLRGRIMPVIEARTKLGLPVIEYTERTCIIEINYQDTVVCLIVDSVADVVDLDQISVSEFPNTASNQDTQYVTNVSKVGERIIMNIDLEKFLTDTNIKK